MLLGICNTFNIFLILVDTPQEHAIARLDYTNWSNTRSCFFTFLNLQTFGQIPLHEKCPKVEFFLVSVHPYLVRITENMEK